MSYVADGPVPWPVPPDWKGGVAESLAWLTDSLQARSGEAQKRELRLAPRRSFTFQVLADDQARRVADALLFDMGARLWALPIWHDIQCLSEPVTFGDSEIPCETEGFEFRNNGRAMLWTSVNRFEVVNIDQVEAASITLMDPLVTSWPVGARLYPIVAARNLLASEESTWTDVASTRKITFAVDEPCDWPAVLPTATYRTFPVLEHRSDEGDDPTVSHPRQIEDVDSDTGKVHYFDYVDTPFRTSSHRWLLGNRAEHAAFRSLLYGLRGRMGVLWVPSMMADLKQVATIGSASLQLVVEWAGYTLFGRLQSNRRDIRIELNSGAVFYRRINGSFVSGAGATETLTLDASLGQAVAPGQVRLISFMTLSESAADTVDLEHITDAAGITRSALAFKAVKHDL